MNKSIGFITYNWQEEPEKYYPHGSVWYRCILPSKELAKYGWTCNVGWPAYSTRKGFGVFNLDSQKTFFDYDIIVFKGVMNKNIAHVLKKIKRNQKIVVDIDDFYEGMPKTLHAWPGIDPERNEKDNINYYIEIVDMADYVITSSSFLYDFYKNKKTTFLIRNAIDVERWGRNKGYKSYRPCVGWVGFPPSRDNDLEQLLPFMGDFLLNNNLSFQHSGSFRDKTVKEILRLSNDVNFIHKEGTMIDKYPSLFSDIDIGLVPLSQSPFNNAKSFVKGLEYAASGVPFVSSSHPEYMILNQDGVGRIANNSKDWIKNLSELIDPKVRKEEAEKNYENIKMLHTMKVRGKDWDIVMNEILKDT